MSRSTHALVLVAALSTWVGCGSDTPRPTDDGSATDAAWSDDIVDWDVAIEGDAEVWDDVGTGDDAASQEDAGAVRDASTPRDAGTVRDASTPRDAGPPSLQYARFRVGSINAPESDKPGLIDSPAARARELIAWLTDRDVTAAAVQESGTYLRRAAAERPRWSTTWAPPNNVFPNREIGNGIVFVNDRLRVIDEQNLKVAMPGRPRGLNLPVRLFQYQVGPGQGARFAMIGFHAPTRSADPSDVTRRAMLETLKTYVRRCHQAGIPVVLAGDSNDGAYGGRFDGMLKVAGHHVVDWILVSREVLVHGGTAYDIPRLSDHDALLASVSVAARSSVPTRLPAAP